MKRYKTKLWRIINFIKNENKFEFGDMVRILPLNKDLGTENFYAKYIFTFYSIYIKTDIAIKELSTLFFFTFYSIYIKTLLIMQK